jgi:glutamate-1-semialdehyde aminotransferase
MGWKAIINKRKLAGEIVDIPGDFVDLPCFYDHSFLRSLNQLAEKYGLLPIFDDVHPMLDEHRLYIITTWHS